MWTMLRMWPKWISLMLKWLRKSLPRLIQLLVYHCAAYTAVDAGRRWGKRTGFCHQRNWNWKCSQGLWEIRSHLVYISIDSCLWWKKPVGQEWEVDDPPGSANRKYGRTKQLVRNLLKSYVTTLYYPHCLPLKYGKTLSLPCKILPNPQNFTVVNDQHVRPTWTRTLGWIHDLIWLKIKKSMATTTYQMTQLKTPLGMTFAVEIPKTVMSK